MLEMVAQVGVTALFYDLMKPVTERCARVRDPRLPAASRRWRACSTMRRQSCRGASSPGTSRPVGALSLAFIKIKLGAAIESFSFGFETLLGWLVFKPILRFLGVSMVSGLGWLTFLGRRSIPGVVGRSSRSPEDRNERMAFIRGVDDVKWRASAALAAA